MLGGHGVKHSTKPHTGHGRAKRKYTRLKRTKRRRQVDDDNNTKLSRTEMINRSPEKKREMNNPSHAGNASLCGRLKRRHFARCEIYAGAASFQDNHGTYPFPYNLPYTFLPRVCLTITKPRKSSVVQGLFHNAH